MDVDDVFARDKAADGHDLLADRIADGGAVDDDHVLVVAPVVAFEMHQPGLHHMVPDDVALGVLDIGVDVVGMVVRPAHRKEHLGLCVDLALLSVGVDR
jgi:hypothetical protein